MESCINRIILITVNFVLAAACLALDTGNLNVRGYVNATSYLYGSALLTPGSVGTAEAEVQAVYAINAYFQYLARQLDAGGFRITGLPSPIADSDAATKAYVNSVALGMNFVQPVDSRTSESGGLHIDGKRYLATEEGDNWTTDCIYQWSGSTWIEDCPTTGTFVHVIDEGVNYIYSNETWNSLGSPAWHNSLLGVSGDGPEYYHHSAAQMTDHFYRSIHTTDDLAEGAENFFFNDNRVDDRIEETSHTCNGQWIFNDNIVLTVQPVEENHVATKYYVDLVSQGVAWKPSVISKTLSTPPDEPTTGARYIVSVAGNWYDPAWSKRLLVTIEGDYIGEELINFPVCIMIDDEESPVFTGAKSDGQDILFTLNDGITKLPHEIDYYSASEHQAIFWVSIPVLEMSVDFELYMYWGNSASPNQSTLTSVFDSDYIIVNHLTPSIGNYPDSSLAKNNGTVYSNPTRGAAGKIGKCIQYDANTTQSVRVPTSTTLNPPTNYQATTLEAWFLADGTSSTTVYIMSMPSAYSRLYMNSTRTGIYGSITNVDAITISVSKSSATVINNWYHLAITYDAITNSELLYLNGTQVASATQSGAIRKSTSMFTIGNYYSGKYSARGKIDEVRVSKKARSAKWLKAQYDNIADMESFITIGSDEDPITSGPWYGHINDIAEWTGLEWIVTEAEPGIACYVEEESAPFVFNGSEWVKFSSIFVHNMLSGLQGGTSEDRWHLSLSQYNAATRIASNSEIGLMPSGKLSNWDAAYTYRYAWNGGTTGLNAETGRASLGLGSASTANKADIVSDDATLPTGSAIISYVDSREETDPIFTGESDNIPRLDSEETTFTGILNFAGVIRAYGGLLIDNLLLSTIIVTDNMYVGGNKFHVDDDGNIVKINNVTYSFPTTNAVGVLTDFQGSGALGWTTLTQRIHSRYGLSNFQSDGTVCYSVLSDSTVIAGDVVYLASDGKVYKSDASSTGTMKVRYLAISSYFSGTISAMLIGDYRNDSFDSMVVGQDIYASETPGKFTQTAPTSANAVVQILGYAIGEKVIRFEPSSTYIVLTEDE